MDLTEDIVKLVLGDISGQKNIIPNRHYRFLQLNSATLQLNSSRLQINWSVLQIRRFCS